MKKGKQGLSLPEGRSPHPPKVVFTRVWSNPSTLPRQQRLFQRSGRYIAQPLKTPLYGITTASSDRTESSRVLSFLHAYQTVIEAILLTN
jgi:hypothetical protein